MRELNDIMSFDHVIRVHEDGTITDENDIFAPELYGDNVPYGVYVALVSYNLDDDDNVDGWAVAKKVES